MIVDTHVHVVSADRQKYPLRAPRESMRLPRGLSRSWYDEVPFSTEQLLEQMGGAGVDRALLVQPKSAYAYDNSYAADSARRCPNRFASVCIIDMLADGAVGCLTQWIETHKVSGLRLLTGTTGEGQWLDDERTFPVWQKATTLQIPVCIQMFPHLIPRLRNLLQVFSDLPVALDHIAHFYGDYEPSPEEVVSLLDLAKFPNLYVKFSTLNIADSCGAAAKNLFKRVVEGFGVRRMMWGSNYPVSHEQSYGQMVALARQTVAYLSVEEQRWLLGGTALSLWPALQGKDATEPG